MNNLKISTARHLYQSKTKNKKDMSPEKSNTYNYPVLSNVKMFLIFNLLGFLSSSSNHIRYSIESKTEG